MSTLAVRADGLSKQYRIGASRFVYDTLRDLLTDGVRSFLSRNGEQGGTNTIWALRDVSFEVPKGQIVGIIGRNGAGKSTLLKILSRITDPTEGRATIHGRVGSLLEVGTGFHPELTGRENIYLNGAILGMKKLEIDRKFDEIVAFSEVEAFIDTPVKRYSSGMQVRLAFAVAAHLEPEILIIDEVLAVGDVAFQRKSLGKMSTVAQEGRTVLFVSHNMVAVQNLCARTILLQHGRMTFDGPTDEAVKEYLAYLDLPADRVFTDNPERRGNGAIRFASARILDEAGQDSQSLIAGRPATFLLQYTNPNRIRRAVWGMKIYNYNGIPVADFDSRYTDFAPEELSEHGALICRLPTVPFPLGEYHVHLWLAVNGRLADAIPNAATFRVDSSVFYGSLRAPAAKDCAVMVVHEWRHEAGTARPFTSEDAQ